MTPDVDDDRLIDDTLAGNTAAFSQLVARYQDRLFNAMAHVSGSVEDARDIVQDALVQAFVKLHSFRRSSGFYTWVYRIAFNVAVSRRRRAKATVSLDHDPAAVGRVATGTQVAPDHRLVARERADRVQAALRSLPEEYRMVLVMREMDDCSYETIADVLDLPVGTVRSRLHRARLQMRELLKEVLETEED